MSRGAGGRAGGGSRAEARDRRMPPQAAAGAARRDRERPCSPALRARSPQTSQQGLGGGHAGWVGGHAGWFGGHAGWVCGRGDVAGQRTPREARAEPVHCGVRAPSDRAAGRALWPAWAAAGGTGGSAPRRVALAWALSPGRVLAPDASWMFD